jgi:soluble lytic murein transglycosylase-like protein
LLVSAIGLIFIGFACSPPTAANTHKKTHSSKVSVKIKRFRPKPTLAEYIQHRYKRPEQQSREIAKAITVSARSSGLDKYVIAGIIARESSFKPRSSNGGNYGLMQIAVSQHRAEIRETHSEGKLHKPTHNISIGSGILSTCLKGAAKGNIQHALSLYNRGCSLKGKTQKIKQGRSYASKVLTEARLAQQWIEHPSN